jgi:hypothetical protein
MAQETKQLLAHHSCHSGLTLEARVLLSQNPAGTERRQTDTINSVVPRQTSDRRSTSARRQTLTFSAPAVAVAVVVKAARVDGHFAPIVLDP